jgi:hypothetical protein
VRTLLAGWFSFEDMGATAGDLLVRDLAERWLGEAGDTVDVALAPPFEGGVRWEEVDPLAYGRMVFACGPLGNGPPVDELFDRFSHCELVGLDLSMLEPLSTWNPFDLLLERDSDRGVRPDLAIGAPGDPVPVIGLVLIHPQPEYGERDRSCEANALLESVAAGMECARVSVDTRLDVNTTGLRTPREVVTLLSRVDVVLTSRLHGLVLALQAGVPVIAVDPVEGGAKVTAQAAALAWPWCHPFDAPIDDVRAAVDACLSPAGRSMADQARRRGQEQVDRVRADLQRWLTRPASGGE